MTFYWLQVAYPLQLPISPKMLLSSGEIINKKIVLIGENLKAIQERSILCDIHYLQFRFNDLLVNLNDKELSNEQKINIMRLIINAKHDDHEFLIKKYSHLNLDELERMLKSKAKNQLSINDYQTILNWRNNQND